VLEAEKLPFSTLQGLLLKGGVKKKIVGFVEEGKYEGVDYINKGKDIKTEVLVITTSQKLDLYELKEKNIQAKLRFLWLHGVAPVKGIDEYEWSGILKQRKYQPKNFSLFTMELIQLYLSGIIDL